MEINKISLSMPKPESLELQFFKDVDEESVSSFYKNYNELLIKYDNIIKDNNIVSNNYGLNLVKDFNYPPINIHLSTFGGSVYDGLSAYSKIKAESRNHKFDTRIIASGKIMSMGIILLLAVPFKDRVAYKDTMFMIHQVSAISLGTVKDIEDRTEELKRLNKQLFDIIKENTSVTEDELNKVYVEKKDWFLTAEEAKRIGLISEIID